MNEIERKRIKTQIQNIEEIAGGLVGSIDDSDYDALMDIACDLKSIIGGF